MNLTFYRYGGHIEFIRFTEYYGMPRAQHSLSIYAHFMTKRENFNVYFLAKRRSFKQYNIFFFYYNLFLRKLEEKLAPKALINTDASISDCAHAPGHPIILLMIQLIKYGHCINKKVYSHKLRLA